MLGYQRSRRAGDVGHRQAVERTLGSAGRGIRWNALVLCAGFLVLTLSGLKPNLMLGVLLAASVVTCYGMTCLWLPFLLGRVTRTD